MGGQHAAEELRPKGHPRGKVTTPLDETLKHVEWEEFKVADLFEVENTLSFNADKLVTGQEYDYVTRTSQSQGVLQKTGFVNKKNINQAGNWSLGLLQMDFFYRQNPWYAGQFVRKIIPKIDLTPKTVPLFTSALNKLKPVLLSVLVRNVDKTFLNAKLTLPATKNGEPDYEVMEDVIAAIEGERIEKLNQYLKDNGLDNYHFTDEEQQALNNFENTEWGEFRIGGLFDRIKTKKLPFKADELSKHMTDNYNLPCLTSSFRNQGLNYFVPKEGATILKNVISIPSNSDVYRAYFQSNEFTILSDAYAIQSNLKDIEPTPNQYLFAVQSINKVTDLPIYSYKNKLGGWNIVKNKYIQLPIKNGEPDYAMMDTIISAIKKRAIKDVVLYVQDKQEAGH